MSTTYRVTIETGQADGAGTDADVYMTLYGTKGNSGERYLDNSDDNFENGKIDIFAIETRDLGQLKAIRLRHDDSGWASGWHVQRVTVHNETTDEEWNFDIQRWFARDEDDHAIDRTIPYE